MNRGKTALSASELLAILIRSGTQRQSALEVARNILGKCGDSLGELAKLSVEDLTRFHGIGTAKAVSIVAALELGRRKQSDSGSTAALLHSSDMAFRFILPHLEDLDHEEFWIACLNKKNRVLKCTCISKGGISETIVDSRILFSTALKVSATSMILFHNHPSGSPDPSNADLQITRKIVAAGRLLDIQILDHIIVGEQGYYSFGDEGRI